MVWSGHELEAGLLLWAPEGLAPQLQEDGPAGHYGSPACEDQPALALLFSDGLESSRPHTHA